MPDGRVRILFERHKFFKFTGGRFAALHPDICNRKAGGYSKTGQGEYGRFTRAFRLDPKAAMMSASWGKFQIMGFNFWAAGFISVDEFVSAMKLSEDAQLKAFVNVIRAWSLDDELQRHDWPGFARLYNGAGYRKNSYDVKMAAAYRDYKREEGGSATTANEPANNAIGDSIVGDLDVADIEEADEQIAESEAEEVPTAKPADKEAVTMISAIPPLTPHIPNWVKRLVTWGATLNVGALGGAFVFLRDNPQTLATVLNIIKWTVIALGGAGLLVLVGLFALKLYYAKLANDLNRERLRNYGNRDTENVDFSGWKGVEAGAQPKT